MSFRLLKVVVQAVVVEDDGEVLHERVCEPVTVSARDWLQYPVMLAAEVANLECADESGAG